MKKLIFFLSVVLVVLCVIAFAPKKNVDAPPKQPKPTTSVVPSTTLPLQTQPKPTQPKPEGWYTVDDRKYYYLDGEPITGWQEVDGLLRYFHADGVLAQGFAEADGKRYYFGTDGCYLTGWQDIAGKRYYLGEDGVVVTGWLQQEEQLYYLRDDGAMARGCVQIDGVNHFFTSTGAPVLVLNPWNSLPEGYEPDLVELSSTYATSGNKVDRKCYDALLEMMKACNKEEPRVCVLSGYRSVKSQEKLFKKQVDRHLNQGYSQEEAEYLAAQVVAVPGTSEHHSGLAVDIIDTRLWALEEEQEDLPAQQWLMEHCWEYGFILRYPKDKIDVTGIIYEPWHYRYVGKELAKELHDLGLTLEEYMTMLTEQNA